VRDDEVSDDEVRYRYNYLYLYLFWCSVLHHLSLAMSSDEESLSGSEEEEVDQRLSNSDVLNKYKSASIALNAVTKRLLEECTPGKTILSLCELGDKLIKEEVAKPYRSQKTLERGVAFPTSISVNHCVGHFCPEVGDNSVLAEGDLAKIDLGAHIDGFIAVASYTIVVGHPKDEPITGKKADLICAVNVAADLILKTIKPGSTNTDVTKIIKKIGETFQVNVVEGVLSHQMKRFVIDGPRAILSKITTDQNVQEITFEEDDVFQIDIVYSTGEGKTRAELLRPTIYKRVVDQTYLLKLKAAREVFNDINKKCPALPFSIRNLDNKHVRFGLGELEKHGMVTSYPVLFEKPGELVAQAKFTVLITSSGPARITQHQVPYVKSEFSIEDPELKEASSESKKKKKKTKKAKVTHPSSSTTTTTTSSEQPPALVDAMETS